MTCIGGGGYVAELPSYQVTDLYGQLLYTFIPCKIAINEINQQLPYKESFVYIHVVLADRQTVRTQVGMRLLDSLKHIHSFLRICNSSIKCNKELQLSTVLYRRVSALHVHDGWSTAWGPAGLVKKS